MTSAHRNFLVGVVVIVSMLGLTWMLLGFAGTTTSALFANGIQVNITAQRADGLGQGAQVEYRGVDVGKVTSVTLASDDSGILIGAQINALPKIPANLKAVIERPSPLGGSAIIRLVADGAPSGTLSSGQTIAGNYASGISDVASQLSESNVIPHLDAVVISVQQQLQKTGQLIDSLQQYTSDPKFRDDLKITLTNIRTTTDNARQITEKLNGMTGQMQSTLDDTHAMIQHTSKNIDDLTHQFGASVVRINSVLDQLTAITAKMNDGKGTIAALLNDRQLYDAMLDTAKQLKITIEGLSRLVDQWEKEGVTIHL